MDRENRTLILGLGNPLSGDDCFGARVVERLDSDGVVRCPGVSLKDVHTDLLNSIGEFAGYDQVILVDAVLDPEGRLGTPGRVSVIEEADFSEWAENSPSAHQMTPVTAVKLFRLLNPAAHTRICLVGLVVDQLTHDSVYATDDRVSAAATAVRSSILPVRGPIGGEKDATD